MATKAVIRDAVRKLCGNPDTTEMSDANIEAYLDDDALDWLNRRRSNITLTSLTTVADQQDYDDKPSDAYAIKDVFWGGSGIEVFSPTLKFIPSSMDMNQQTAGFSVIDNSSLVEIVYKNLEQYKRNFEGGGYETREGKIRLEPAPNTSGDTVYFFYTNPRFDAVTDITSEFLQGFKWKAASLILENLFIDRGIVRGGRDFSGGGGANEGVMAEKYEKRAEAAIPILGSVFSHG